MSLIYIRSLLACLSLDLVVYSELDVEFKLDKPFGQFLLDKLLFCF